MLLWQQKTLRFRSHFWSATGKVANVPQLVQTPQHTEPLGSPTLGQELSFPAFKFSLVTYAKAAVLLPGLLSHVTLPRLLIRLAPVMELVGHLSAYNYLPMALSIFGTTLLLAMPKYND